MIKIMFVFCLNIFTVWKDFRFLASSGLNRIEFLLGKILEKLCASEFLGLKIKWTWSRFQIEFEFWHLSAFPKITFYLNSWNNTQLRCQFSVLTAAFTLD